MCQNNHIMLVNKNTGRRSLIGSKIISFGLVMVVMVNYVLVFCLSKIGEAILRKIIDRRGILKNTIYIDQRDNKEESDIVYLLYSPLKDKIG